MPRPPEPPAHATAPPPDDALLVQDIQAIRRASAGGTQTAPAAVARNHRTMQTVLARWLPEARLVRDRTRSRSLARYWAALINTVEQPLSRPVTFETVMVRARDVIALLDALRASLPAHPSVEAIAQRLADDIDQGLRVPGEWLKVDNLAAAYGAPPDRIRHALADLAEQRVVIAYGNGAHRVPRKGN